MLAVNSNIELLAMGSSNSPLNRSSNTSEQFVLLEVCVNDERIYTVLSFHVCQLYSCNFSSIYLELCTPEHHKIILEWGYIRIELYCHILYCILTHFSGVSAIFIKWY